jgi:hypothetical protein
MAEKHAPAKPGSKGYALEELLRHYFLSAGYYVVRAVPLRHDGEDLTDVDLWLYERPSGFARRRTIVDAKFRNRSRAGERLLWTSGLRSFLGVEAAYVATTDTRASVKSMAKTMGLSVLDGNDIDRIASSSKTTKITRASGEEFDELIRKIDSSRHSREWSNHFIDVKAALIDGFGAASVNRALAAAGFFAEQAVVSPPGSETAKASVRLALFSASISAVSLDYVLSDASFRPTEERHARIVSVVRYGQPDRDSGLAKVRLAAVLIGQFGDNGAAVARQVENRFEDESQRIPAEIIADHVVRMTQPDQSLFKAACDLESAAFDRTLGSFDRLPPAAKGLMGALLDFCGITRSKFAEASGRDTTSPAESALQGAMQLDGGR